MNKFARNTAILLVVLDFISLFLTGFSAFTQILSLAMTLLLIYLIFRKTNHL